MEYSYHTLATFAEEFGPTFYLLDTARFTENFCGLRDAFRHYYPNSHIAYSYKTNYIPRLCALVNSLGGYAEVVSDMECTLARRVGVDPHDILFNGPFKNPSAVEQLLLDGGVVHLDNAREFPLIRALAEQHPDRELRLGLRCNYRVGDGVDSRFGMDIHGEAFSAAVQLFETYPNLKLTGLHCHVASRDVAYWGARVDGLLTLYDSLPHKPDYLDLGGGIYGHMPDELKAQFASPIPSFEEYAAVAAARFAEHFRGQTDTPKLILEPGSALAGDVMQFAAPVTSVKTVRGKPIATVLGSMYNINPTLNHKNPPLTVYACGAPAAEYTDLDFGGYTCIESDFLYRGYRGPLAVGDYVVFDNVGSYSVVLKPPFILPNFAVIDPAEQGDRRLVKRAENFDDIFHTYSF